MRIAYEFKVSPQEVQAWDTELFDYACAYINMRDEAEKKAQDEMRARQGAAHTRPAVMRGGRR